MIYILPYLFNGLFKNIGCKVTTKKLQIWKEKENYIDTKIPDTSFPFTTHKTIDAFILAYMNPEKADP
jgi:hypothetical protein